MLDTWSNTSPTQQVINEKDSPSGDASYCSFLHIQLAGANSIFEGQIWDWQKETLYGYTVNYFNQMIYNIEKIHKQYHIVV